jgi:hypothetical protein
MRQQMDALALWQAFGITADIKAKLLAISPATIDRVLKKDKAALALKGKSLTKPGRFLFRPDREGDGSPAPPVSLLP